MKPMLLAALIATTTLPAEDSPSASVREKLHAKLLASFPPPQPIASVDDARKTERPEILAKADAEKSPDEPVVQMAPLVVAETGRDRNLEAVIDRQSQQESFSVASGGTLLKKDVGKVRIELGSWSTGSGVSFLRISW